MRPRPRASTRSAPLACPRRHRARAPLRAALAGILSATLALPAGAAPASDVLTTPEAPPTTTAPTSESPPTSPAPTTSATTSPAPTTSATTSPAPETGQAEALRLFRAARVLYNAGEFLAAARDFEASYAAAPSPEAAYNAALAHDRVGDRVATLTWFRRYLAGARRDTDPSYPLAVQRAGELSARLGELSLRIDHPEALRELRLNGAVVAPDAFPLLLEPGRVELRFIGERPDQVVDISSEVPAGGPTTIHFPGFSSAPVARPDPPPVKTTPPREPAVDPRTLPRHRTLRGLFWAGAGLTGAGALAVGVLGGLTLRARSDYATAYVPTVPPGNYTPNKAAQERYDELRLATNVMIGVAAGLAVITLALGIVTLQHGRRLRPRARAGRLNLAANGLQLAF